MAEAHRRDPPLALQQRGESLAAGLPPLLVAAERVASTVAQGVHGRRRVGQGETFWQFRQYEIGDSPQSIDWRQTAKSDRVFVRQLEWEAAQSVWLWRDGSASMDWRSSRDLPSKRERADLLLLALIVLLLRAGERVALLGKPGLPSSSRGSLSRLALTLERETAAGVAAGVAAGAGTVDRLPPVETLPRFAQVVLLGDFLAPLEQIEADLKRYAERGLKGHVLQILDPAEATLPYHGRVRFEGLEGEPPWLLGRAETVRESYLRRLSLQTQGVIDICRRIGWTAGQHRTDASAQAALLGLYGALSQRVGL
ncbi:Protein of unknown function DUF58 [Tistlia consotensis]|uniref:DUF58 domain-containing protein n=1 Tax=Tistlia consotensis USBA 355 TaxID=560819 RepID=A0A1Y6C5F5_9PROT|nr:DUF58 domain-containing protein [Tistlia consotensis]SMF46569.1 Protein of unknown function DUF58 [Tistlia consotensis USBA 355]SNR78235.1 Protein of unknown function DUF58 [Tistlia consotensis]